MTESIIFLLYSSYVDIKNRSVSIIACILASLFLITICLSTNSPNPILNALIGYGVAILISWLISHLNVDIGGGDAKVVGIVCGFGGLILGVLSFILALTLWFSAEHPKKVAFVPYLLVSFLLLLYIQGLKW